MARAAHQMCWDRCDCALRWPELMWWFMPCPTAALQVVKERERRSWGCEPPRVLEDAEGEVSEDVAVCMEAIVQPGRVHQLTLHTHMHRPAHTLALS